MSEQSPNLPEPRFMPNADYSPPPPPGQPPYGGGFPPGPGGGLPPQPPKRRHTVRNIFIGLGALLLILIIVGVVAGLNSSTNSPVASVTCNPQCPGQGASSPAAPAAQESSAAPSPTPSPQFSPQTLLSNSGSGAYNTARFTVGGGSGDYDVYWTYSAGGQGTANFSISGDGGSDSNITDPNQLGAGGSGVIHVYNDAGTHYLTVSSEGSWTVKVVTTP